MFVDGGGWRPPRDPPRRLPLTKRQENILLWLILSNAFLALVAPLGGGTVFEAVVAVVRRFIWP